MIKRLPFLVLLLIAACRCNSSTDGPPPTGRTEVTLAGKTLSTGVFFGAVKPDGGITRSRTANILQRLGTTEAALIGYAHDRHIHVFGEIREADFDVAFLDSAGKVVDSGDITNDEGAVSSVPARFALLLRHGWLEQNGVKKGDAATFAKDLAGRKPERLPVMKIGDKTLHLEMARDDEERRRGFMHRTHLSENDGMLFVYQGAEENHRFWMMNTLINLDIVFIRRDGTIVNVVETPKWADPQMDPDTRSESTGPCQYVLEVNYGWFRKNGFLDDSGNIKPDVIVEIPAAFRVR